MKRPDYDPLGCLDLVNSLFHYALNTTAFSPKSVRELADGPLIDHYCSITGIDYDLMRSRLLSVAEKREIARSGSRSTASFSSR